MRLAGINEKHQPKLIDHVLYVAHNTLSGIEPLRVAAGAGSNTRETPHRVVDFEPQDVSLGMWDNESRARRMASK